MTLDELDKQILKRLDKQRAVKVYGNLTTMLNIKQWVINNDMECEIYTNEIFEKSGFIFWFPNQEDAMAFKLTWT